MRKPSDVHNALASRLLRSTVTKLRAAGMTREQQMVVAESLILGLVGYYAARNAAPEAVLDAMLAAVRARFPDVIAGNRLQ